MWGNTGDCCSHGPAKRVCRDTLMRVRACCRPSSGGSTLLLFYGAIGIYLLILGNGNGIVRLTS